MKYIVIGIGLNREYAVMNTVTGAMSSPRSTYEKAEMVKYFADAAEDFKSKEKQAII